MSSSAVVIAGVVRCRHCFSTITATKSTTSLSSELWLPSTRRRTSHNITTTQRTDAAAPAVTPAAFRSTTNNNHNNNHNAIKNWTAMSIATAAASCLPLLIWARDSLFGFVRVQGNSGMEPTLRHGDVLLVRKADRGVLPNILMNAIFGGISNSSVDDDASSLAREQRRVRQHEKMQAAQTGGSGHYYPNANLYENPPLVVSGQVVVLLSPDTAFPSEWIVKRVIGVGGQWLLPPPAPQQHALSYKDEMSRSRNQHSRQQPRPNMLQRTKLLPPYTLYVQGDNPESRDSRQYGPVSNNLLVGVAEYVVWPPTRWQRIRRRTQTRDDDDDDDDDDETDDEKDDFSHMHRAYWL